MNGEFTSDGNRDFDQSLRNRDATWGIRFHELLSCLAFRAFSPRISHLTAVGIRRDIKELEELGCPLGFALEKRYDMPANNFLLHFRKP